MTWEGQCPDCRSEQFRLTINSADDVHVNCGSCDTYIGKMLAANILHPPIGVQ